MEDIGYGHGQSSPSSFNAITTGSCANCWLGIQFQPSSVGMQAVTVNLSSSAAGQAEPIILTAALQINNPTTSTPSFTPITNCTTVAPSATCTISVTFIPGTANAADALTIHVTSTTSGAATYTVPLTGSYATQGSGLQIIPALANFGPQSTSSLGPTRQFTINNLTAKSLSLSLSLPSQFVLTPHRAPR